MRKSLLGLVVAAGALLALPAGASATVYSCPTFQVVKPDPSGKLQSGTYGRRVYEPNSGRNRPWSNRQAACDASYHMLYSYLYNPVLSGWKVRLIGPRNSQGLYAKLHFSLKRDPNVYIVVEKRSSSLTGVGGTFTG